MMNFKLLLFLMIISAPALVACQTTDKEKVNYIEQIQSWHQARIERLRAKDSWLTLIGLFWLKEGENTFGSDSANTIIFPAKAPKLLGAFSLREGKVNVRINPQVEVINEGQPVTELLLISDAEGKPTVLTSGSLSWLIIKRGEQYGVRLKDSESPALIQFKDIDMFPIDPAWRIKAKFEPYNPPKKIPVPNVLGQVNEEECPGALAFELNGQTYRLDPLAEADAKQFFIIFADETNGEETYGAGRFLYVDKPDQNGEVIIDFNKSYNPPCVFSEFATCPLPPRQNRLLVKITAGEKNYSGVAH